MIISHEHKFIFLRTKKTAGTSIEIALSQFCGEGDVITPIPVDEELRKNLSHRGLQNFSVPLTKYTPEERALLERLYAGMPKRLNKKRVRYYNHMVAEQVRAMIGAEIWDEYFKFCFERNPWDKAISRYFWITRKYEPRPSLLEFLRADSVEGLSNFGIYSIDGELAVDHVGLYEDLDSELERIAELLNLPGGIKIPRAKGDVREDRRHYRDVMGHEERSIVAQVCAREIARFGYSF